MFASKSLSLCLHVLNISDLELREAPPPENIIWYFSFKHNLHFLVVGLKGGALSMMSHSMLKGTPLSFKLHIWVERVVEFSLFLYLKEFLCL